MKCGSALLSRMQIFCGISQCEKLVHSLQYFCLAFCFVFWLWCHSQVKTGVGCWRVPAIGRFRGCGLGEREFAAVRFVAY
jgi:hypothetical protein